MILLHLLDFQDNSNSLRLKIAIELNKIQIDIDDSSFYEKYSCHFHHQTFIKL